VAEPADGEIVLVTARIAGSLFDTSKYSDHDLARATKTPPVKALISIPP
jgi:hypothetical protein